MLRTTTPEVVPHRENEALKRFRAKLGDEPGVLVDVDPPNWASFNQCYPNAVRCVDEGGGIALPGWKIWVWPRVWFHAVHHCVWRRDDGSMVDVTPQENMATKVFFVANAYSTFDPSGLAVRPDRYKLLWKHRKLLRLLELISERDQLLANHRALLDGKIVGTFDPQRIEAIVEEIRPLWAWVARNRK